MKIRIMGTLLELEIARDYYLEYEKSPDVKYVMVSKPYPNRGSNTVFRLYVDIEMKESTIENRLLASIKEI